MSPSAPLAVLGGNELACPALRRIRERGHRLLVVDGNASAPARELAERFVHVNFFDWEATRAALADQPLSGVLPINDFGVRTASRLAAERGLPGSSWAAARALTNKLAMRRAWAAAGLPQPRFTALPTGALLAGERTDWRSFPCIVKPAFSGGGSRGVARVGSWGEARDFVAASKASFLDDEVILEEFVAGSEHTAEVLVWPGGKRLLSISDKENYPGNVAVVQNLFFPGPKGHVHRDRIEPLVLAACDALGMTVGAAHFEVLIRDGEVSLLEVGGRPGGGINLHPICLLSTGLDYAALYAAVLTGADPVFERGPSCHLAWHYFETGRGVLREIRGAEAVRADPDVVDLQIYEQVGQPLRDKRDDLARPGYVLVRGASHAEARRRALELGRRVEFVTEP